MFPREKGGGGGGGGGEHSYCKGWREQDHVNIARDWLSADDDFDVNTGGQQAKGGHPKHSTAAAPVASRRDRTDW